MKTPNILKQLFVSFLILLNCSFGRAEQSKGEAIHVYVENDTRRIGGPGSDNAYSSGVKISYSFAENDVPPWAKAGMKRSGTIREAIEGSKTNFGFSLGHQIYTPNDITRKELISDDRPYAGWFYLGFSAQFQNSAQSHAVEFDVGVIGPEALGKPVQNGFHRVIGIDEAQGWDHQMKTEPAVQLSYQQRLRFFDIKIAEQKYFDVVPFFGAGLGNVSIEAHVGGMVRLGTLLDEDLGPARPSMTNGDNFFNPTSSKGDRLIFYIFAAGQSYAIARNIFLDGNTFRSSHRVTKYPFLIETEFGYFARYRNWSGSWRFVSRSPEFEQRSKINSFASISIGYAY